MVVAGKILHGWSRINKDAYSCTFHLFFVLMVLKGHASSMALLCGSSGESWATR
jgi:hypothetical protein